MATFYAHQNQLAAGTATQNGLAALRGPTHRGPRHHLALSLHGDARWDGPPAGCRWQHTHVLPSNSPNGGEEPGGWAWLALLWPAGSFRFWPKPAWPALPPPPSSLDSGCVLLMPPSCNRLIT
ncbi:UNVERIFIED_CONTAM: hypothetical protein K2H54_018049 [Gekko kuhli]